MEETQPKAFANSFWVNFIDKGTGMNGFTVLTTRMKKGKRTCDEIQSMLKERALIEEDYGKKLMKMAKNFSPGEDGTMGEALTTVRNELEQNGRAHLELSADLKSKLIAPLQEFTDTQSLVRKNHQKAVERLAQQKNNNEQQMLKIRDKYYQKCQEYVTTQEYVRNSPPTRETEKAKLKLEKIYGQQRALEQEYLNLAQKNIDSHNSWKTDMTIACIDYQKLEEDRFNFIRGNMWKYANFLSSTCVLNDESSERIRLDLEKCSFDTDLIDYIEKNATGSSVLDPIGFEPFEVGLNNTLNEMNLRASSQDSFSENNSDLGHNGNIRMFAFQQQQQQPPNTMERSVLLDQSTMDSTFLYDPYDVPDASAVLFTVKVMFDYESNAREELTIKKDELIPVTATHEDGWWEGIMVENGRRRKGLFPSNFTVNV